MTRLEIATAKYYEDPNYCGHCGKCIEVTPRRPPCDARRQKYCCRSCAAKVNNVLYQKRVSKYEGLVRIGPSTYKNICPICGELKDIYAKHCHNCKRANSLERMMLSPMSNYVYNNGNARVKYSKIRTMAREFLDAWEIPQVCKVCGYDIHVQCCHIKPISEFDEHTSLIIDVNHPNNLVYLCPNHHWEMDHGYLKL
jgi:hypothetical protein